MVLRVGEKNCSLASVLNLGFICMVCLTLSSYLFYNKNKIEERDQPCPPQVYISPLLLLIIKAVLFYNVELIHSLQTSSSLICFQTLWSIDEGRVKVQKSCCLWSVCGSTDASDHLLTPWIHSWISDRQCDQWYFLCPAFITSLREKSHLCM